MISKNLVVKFVIHLIYASITNEKIGVTNVEDHLYVNITGKKVDVKIAEEHPYANITRKKGGVRNVEDHLCVHVEFTSRSRKDYAQIV